MENGDYLLMGQDHGLNLKEIARHSQHDADAYEQYSHDMEMVCHALKPLLDTAPPDIFSDDPEELIALAALGSRIRRMDKHDGEFGAWSFHKGGNGGFTQVLARATQSFGAEIVLESPVAEVITKGGRATGVALVDGTEYHAKTVVSSLDPRRAFLELVNPRELPADLVENIGRFRFQGTSSKVNFALDGLPGYPALGDRVNQFRGFTNIGPTMDYLERAYDDAKYGWYSSRPYIDAAIQSTIDPDMAPPASTS